MDKNRKKPEKGRITAKQIIALAGVAVLLLLYLVTLLTAFLDNSASGYWFRISLIATIAVPLVIWVYAWMYARLTGKHTIGDPEDPAVKAAGSGAREEVPDPAVQPKFHHTHRKES